MLVIFCLKGGLKLPRDGTKKLKPVTERTKEEARAISSKGGKASGIARRRKADLKKAFETLLALDVTDSKIKKQLEEMGMAGENEALLAFATFQQAVKDDIFLVDGGHYGTEFPVVFELQRLLQTESEKRGWEVKFVVDSTSRDFISYL